MVDLAPPWSKQLGYFGARMAVIRFRWDAGLLTKEELKKVLDYMDGVVNWIERDNQ